MVQDVYKQQSGTPHSLSGRQTSAMVSCQFIWSHTHTQKTKWCASKNEISWAAYTSFLKLPTEKVMSLFYYMQWVKMILISKLFCESLQRKVHEDSLSQHGCLVWWTNIIAYTGHLKIWIFMLTMEWIYQDLQPCVMCHLGVLWNCTSSKEELLVLSTSICLEYPLSHYTCHSAV